MGFPFIDFDGRFFFVVVVALSAVEAHWNWKCIFTLCLYIWYAMRNIPVYIGDAPLDRYAFL